MTGSSGEWAPSITTDWLLLLKKPLIQWMVVNTVAVEGGKELLVTDLVKGFCEVHYYYVCLLSVMETIEQVVCELKQLAFTGSALPETVLLLILKTVIGSR